VFGFDRGLPIDRYYIEGFLQAHAADIHGRTLEILDASYTRRFGSDRVTRSDVLHAGPGNPEATLVGDLVTGEGIPSSAFDCLILTQTLQFLPDPAAGLLHAWSALKPGGVLLATFPGISQISRYEAERWGDYWRFTEQSAKLLFAARFGPDNITVRTHGNVLTACAFLHGLATSELTKAELDYHDEEYPLLISVRAVKSEVAR
jgi:SAM-dependent methyltransferase